jgi:hypothetical protein
MSSVPHPEDTDNPWLTIAEAAVRLNLHARHVRRIATRLKGTADHSPVGDIPIRVRWLALLALRPPEPEDVVDIEEDSGVDIARTGPSWESRLLLSQISLLHDQLREKDRQIAALQEAQAALVRLLEAARERDNRPVPESNRLNSAPDIVPDMTDTRPWWKRLRP